MSQQTTPKTKPFSAGRDGIFMAISRTPRVGILYIVIANNVSRARLVAYPDRDVKQYKYYYKTRNGIAK